MVDVGVGQDDRVDGGWVEVREVTVDLVGVVSATLVEAAVEENALSVDF